MQKPLVSVIVPVYKVEDYLDKCVKSIVAQTYENLEIILVDDGSPDNCPSMCDSWAQKDSRIKVIHKENGGVSSARNSALDAAAGDYICFVDSDDFIEPNAVGYMLENIGDADVIQCSFSYDYLDGRTENLRHIGRRALRGRCGTRTHNRPCPPGGLGKAVFGAPVFRHTL